MQEIIDEEAQISIDETEENQDPTSQLSDYFLAFLKSRHEYIRQYHGDTKEKHKALLQKIKRLLLTAGVDHDFEIKLNHRTYDIANSISSLIWDLPINDENHALLMSLMLILISRGFDVNNIGRYQETLLDLILAQSNTLRINAVLNPTRLKTIMECGIDFNKCSRFTNLTPCQHAITYHLQEPLKNLLPYNTTPISDLMNFTEKNVSIKKWKKNIIKVLNGHDPIKH